MAAQSMIGEPWSASGTITAVDDYGLTLSLPDSTEVYVELGPPTYWQAQGVALAPGMPVMIDGFFGEQGYHAAVVNTADDQHIQLRTAEGQPLWSGGVANENNGQNRNGAQDGEHSPEPQAQVDEWLTYEGVITAMTRGQITMQTLDGQIITFQMGQPRFYEAQGITLEIGDEIRVLGFYQGEQFSAGDVTNLATGQTLMLRDPNGRPLWAGPGGNGGQGNGNANGQNGNQ
jgi:hypothetical protein